MDIKPKIKPYVSKVNVIDFMKTSKIEKQTNEKDQKTDSDIEKLEADPILSSCQIEPKNKMKYFIPILDIGEVDKMSEKTKENIKCDLNEILVYFNNFLKNLKEGDGNPADFSNPEIFYDYSEKMKEFEKICKTDDLKNLFNANKLLFNNIVLLLSKRKN